MSRRARDAAMAVRPERISIARDGGAPPRALRLHGNCRRPGVPRQRYAVSRAPRFGAIAALLASNCERRPRGLRDPVTRFAANPPTAASTRRLTSATGLQRRAADETGRRDGALGSSSRIALRVASRVLPRAALRSLLKISLSQSALSAAALCAGARLVATGCARWSKSSRR